MNSFLKGTDWDHPDVTWGLCDVKTRLDRRKSTGCINSPGFGSGLTWNPCGEKVFTHIVLLCTMLHPSLRFDFPQASVSCMLAL
jgi:hypothetical protein